MKLQAMSCIRPHFVRLSGLVVLLFCVLAPALQGMAAEGEIELTLPDPLGADLSTGRLNTLKENIVETGLAPDAIRSIDAPIFVDISNAALVEDDKDVVFVADFGVNASGQRDVRIYPHSIMVWHQVVNDTTDMGERVAITYCPLTGSLVGYRSRVGDYTTNFGVTGLLVNDNAVLYDRATNSQWPQLLGAAIDGPLRGEKLDRFPLLWTTFERASKAYPEARVLSRTTGLSRNYGRDPYGNYRLQGSYYYDDMIVYPLTYWDKRLRPKERIQAVQSSDGQPFAVRVDAVREAGALNFQANMLSLVAIHDQELDTVRIYNREVDGKELAFEMVAGELRDKQTRSIWSMEGECLSGVYFGRSLQPHPTYHAFWFAYAAFYPSSIIVPEVARPWREQN